MTDLNRFDEDLIPLPSSVVAVDLPAVLSGYHLADQMRQQDHDRALAERRDRDKKALLALIEVADALDRVLAYARAAAGESAPARRLAESLDATERVLRLALDKWEVRRLEVVGKPLDPLQCMVVDEVDDRTVPDDTVVKEILPGYAWRGAVLRAARVAISRH